MSEVQSPRPGTREYYAQKMTPENSRTRESIHRLLTKVYKEVADQMPEDQRPTNEELSDVDGLHHHEFFPDFYLQPKKYTLSPRGKQILSIGDRSRRLISAQLLGNISEDSAYRFLQELDDAISKYPGHLDGSNWDDGTKEMGKEWESNFVGGWISAFLNREHLDGDFIFEESSILRERAEWSYARKYQLLVGIASLPEDQKIEVIKSICAELPSYPGAEFGWNDIQRIYDEVVSPI